MAAPQAAIKLLDCMARFHRDENSRLEAFCDWHDKWVGFRFSDARRGSISSGSADKPCLDGEFYVVGSSCNYLVVLLEVKDELGSSGDPHYQLQRYMQQCYSKRMWHEDPVICALGAPALGVDLAGPNLLIHGLYTLHSDCIVSEALTPRIPLVQQGARQPRQLHLLAATLAGYAAAAWALAERMVRAAGGVAADLPLLEQRAREVLGSLSQLGVEYEAALASASLEPAQVQAVADWRVAAAPAPTAAAPLPPYPLLHSIDAALSQLPGLDGKLLYTATEADGRAQFIKFTTLLYPKHVHDAWQEEGLVPTLHRCDALPGAYCCVATELLAATDGWKMLPELGDSSPDQQQCFGAVEQALSRAHSILVQHGGGRALAVHGDMRGPNIMGVAF
ncbi:hypothetical protein MNEG_0458 [Monoraphidium neglectum]|uniref:Uncharacterized protein n=1 Tax=Monoraphidium neglectum TaxID=145388 RepID=A0A0D2MYC6_9CHLO|nr:hypothetical protein MNEG_0458 [Monoraphidium neglectum]KIZ07490.1 hypothetical protein MNEG_0458 [Monoraphidium neglectum]|eukprot:XP_013906509.1 hypothetical protein MNEG_0458 [Monoraphidium neglectum]